MTHDTPRTLLAGQTHLDVRAIERELMQLWKSAADQGEGEASTVTRTCVMNLLVVTTPAFDATPVIADLTDSLPSRAIVINLDPAPPAEGEPALDAWVQAHCQLPAPGRPQVCCEQITIAARGEGRSRVPGTILPLLLPDVAVATWYPYHARLEDDLFARLTELSDRIIIDTATFPSADQALRGLAGIYSRVPALADLAWGRLTIWREQLAQCFDAPALIPRLAEAERLTIVATPGRGRVEALLLAGWLASRLGWRLRERTPGGELHLDRKDGRVVVELRDTQRELPEGVDVEQVTLACAGVTCSLALSGADGLLTTTDVPGRPTLRRSVRLPLRKTSELLADELRLPVSDPTYLAALQAAVGLLPAEG
jgi:glucose-6-phosphate dehydrogenase assembly protein OpcA